MFKNSYSSSNYFNFKIPSENREDTTNLIAFGDLGYSNDISVDDLTQEINTGMYDAILHIGDFAYNLDSESGHNGDNFLNLIQPFAANIPYMTCPGNHESANNFTDYIHRFNMPGNAENLWYSWNIRNVHIISFSTEVYYYSDQKKLIQKQYQWLKQDLENANLPENRAKRPWIITMGHRPMYFDSNDSDEFHQKNDKVRLSLEKLFYQNKVDLQLWAHEHNYQRMYPVYNLQSNRTQMPYVNPEYPIHIITGAAGCPEYLDGFTKTENKWSYIHVSRYGYGKIKISKNTLYWEQMGVFTNGFYKDFYVVDKMWLIKYNP